MSPASSFSFAQSSHRLLARALLVLAVALVCGFGLCHTACRATGDCPVPQKCVKTSASASDDSGTSDEAATSDEAGAGTISVCQLPATCNFNSDCAEGLVCAADRQCRNQCK